MKRNINTPHRLRRIVVYAAALSLVAAACGDDNKDTSSTTSAPAGAASSTSSTSAATAATNSTAAASSSTAGSAASGERPAGWPKTLTLGAVPAEQATSLEASFDTTRKILIKELGLEKIDFFQATDYAGIIEGMIAGRIDVAQFGPFSYVIASSHGAKMSVAGVMTKGKEIPPGYRSYGIVPVKSDIKDLAGYKGKKVCFVDPGSTSGFLFPSAGLLSVGIDPSETSTDITPTFAGGHDASALAVKNGDCDAGFAYDTMLTSQLIKKADLKGVIDEIDPAESINKDTAELKIVWKSETIPGSPMAINNKLPADFIAAFQKVLTEKVNVDWAVANKYCTGDLQKNDCSFSDEDGTWGFVARDDKFYDGIRKVCETTKASKCN